MSNSRFLQRGIVPLLILAGVAFQRPAVMWNANRAEQLHVSRLFIAGMVAFLTSVVLSLGLARVTRRSLVQISIGVGFVMFSFFNWTRLDDPVGDLDSNLIRLAMFLAGLGLVGLLSAREWIRPVAIIVVISMTATPATLALIWSATHDSSAITRPAFTATMRPGTRLPDVYFVVLDGYARADVLRRFYGFDNSRFLEALRDNGFEIQPRAKVNYSMTYASIPSALVMGYPVEAGPPVDEEANTALNRAASGDNPVVEHLKSLGYRYLHVESGIGRTRCGPLVDECFSAPVLDESMWALLRPTPLGSWIARRWGHFVTVDGRAALRRLQAIAREPQQRKPRFIFVHVLLPHPPLFLASDCSVVVDAKRGGVVLSSPETREFMDVRRAAYVSQTQCVNRQMLKAIEAMDPSAVVLIASDHGPDSHEQLWSDIETWTSLQVFERMSSFAAYRLPRSCDREPPVSLVNAFRVILGCVTGVQLPLLPDRHFLVTRQIDDAELTLQVDVAETTGKDSDD